MSVFVVAALKHWKMVLVAVAFVALGAVAQFYKARADHYRTSFEDARVELRANEKQFEALAKGREDLLDRLYNAQARIEQIERTSKTVTLREQVVPKQCQEAIDFAIEHKGDLSW